MSKTTPCLLVVGFAVSALLGSGSSVCLAKESDRPLPAEEVIFAVRPLGSDGHWYANFGYYADSKLKETSVPKVN